MRRLRFFCESISTESVLDPVEAHHLSRVMHVSVGQAVELFDGNGTLAEGIVTESNKKRVIVKSHNIQHSSPAKCGRTILAVSFAKSQRFDWMVEKSTELGVDHIAAVQFERTVKQGSNSAMERYRKISIAAAKQCGRLFLPKTTGPAAFTDTLNELHQIYPGADLLYGDPEAPPLTETAVPANRSDRIIAIGPEGGLTDAEIETLNTAGGRGVSISPNVLRIETAAVAFCAILGAYCLK